MKEQKPIEYRQYSDVKTGEVFDIPVIHHEASKNKDFEMIFYGHFLEILNDLGNKKVQVLQYIIKNKSKSENVFIGTQVDIAKALNINIMTVNKTLLLLEDKGAITKKTGVIYINGDLICDGRFKDRIMHIYNDLSQETEEDKQSRIKREIIRKEEEIIRLKNMQKYELEFA
jgi:DNA-binding transcriptional regulator YhcF (GntR family)